MIFLSACTQQKPTINIAVASNFEKSLKIIINKYQETHPYININIISGSSGILATQILNNAPFDLYLSADTDKPQNIFQQLKLKQNPEIYAIGRLALWIPNININNCISQLAKTKTLAVANPKTAPYGKVAQMILQENDIKVQKIINTSSVMQSYIYTKEGLTEAGFVPYSLLTKDNKGCIQVFENKQLSQAMIILDSKAKEIYDYILTKQIQIMINSFGYDIIKNTK